MTHRVTLIPGDGIGPEITAATTRILEATGVSFEWEVVQAGVTAMEQQAAAEPLPDSVIESIRRNKLALKGPIGTPIGTGFRSVNVALRQGLDLYACVRPCKTYPGIMSRYSDIDLVIVRENTEDLYAGIEFDQGSAGAKAICDVVQAHLPKKGIREDAAVSLKPISESGSRRIVEFAFQYAKENHRRKVTAIHKANIMKASDGLFLRVAREVAAAHPEIEFEEMIVDAACMNLVIRPESFDVMVLGNLYGDIVSDLCAGLVGGLGVAPGSNIGLQATVFEATHGTAPTIAGKGIANPLAMLLSGRLMLEHIGERDAARRLDEAIKVVLRDGKHLTPDLNPTGEGTTEGFADAIIAALGTAVSA
ncbi:MAG: isocitrate/isopropylmalate dehydrogenase family protein [Candidatus Sericytochromatia bacterium]|nr:isocitrate/isopropylmalate dehydrogenase family protein [Candidatus Sericytochromatia bacterium]